MKRPGCKRRADSDGARSPVLISVRPTTAAKCSCAEWASATESDSARLAPERWPKTARASARFSPTTIPTLRSTNGRPRTELPANITSRPQTLHRQRTTRFGNIDRTDALCEDAKSSDCLRLERLYNL